MTESFPCTSSTSSASHGGAVQLADSLRAEGWAAPLTPGQRRGGIAYQRPLLSKDYLADGTIRHHP